MKPATARTVAMTMRLYVEGHPSLRQSHPHHVEDWTDEPHTVLAYCTNASLAVGAWEHNAPQYPAAQSDRDMGRMDSARQQEGSSLSTPWVGRDSPSQICSILDSPHPSHDHGHRDQPRHDHGDVRDARKLLDHDECTGHRQDGHDVAKPDPERVVKLRNSSSIHVRGWSAPVPKLPGRRP